MGLQDAYDVAYDMLCIYDHRSSVYETPDFDDDEPRTPRNGCCCDRCFYGKDALAVRLLAALDELS